VYPGMKKIALILAAALLAAPALAHAKAGVEFQTYPDTAKPGEKINFTVIAMREPPPGGGGRTQPQAIVGRHPLVTFRSGSGRVVHVRAGATDLNGIAHGQVAFPDRGPWTTELSIGDEIRIGPERSEPIRVGVGLTQTTPAAATAAASSEPDSFPWVWVLSLASIGSALLVLLMRRRGHWGAA
jgi:hypothetical protein